MGYVDTIFTAPSDGDAMEEHDAVEAVEGGLEGDRYLLGTGHYSPYDVCQVTLVAGEALDEIRHEHGIDLTDGRHRRNIVTRGVSLRELIDTTFSVGAATLRGTRPRPPCAHVERVAAEAGVARALKEGRGGICADVLEPGRIRVGDTLEIVEASPRDVGAEIAARLEERRTDG